MDVTNCKSCGRLFNAIGRERLCPACKKALEEKFQTVKAYLEEHPDTSVEQTAADNDVTMKQIRQWLKEERLILSSATVAGIVCEKCGKPIRTGRFCDKCKENMASQLESMYDKPKPGADIKTAEPGGNRMRYLKK